MSSDFEGLGRTLSSPLSFPCYAVVDLLGPEPLQQGHGMQEMSHDGVSLSLPHSSSGSSSMSSGSSEEMSSRSDRSKVRSIAGSSL